jgi:hypothetical protein
MWITPTNNQYIVDTMAAHNVMWTCSQKGKKQLVVDSYVFEVNGKGKAADVLYWKCSTSGCTVGAKTEGDRLSEIRGEHGHVNDSAKIANMNMKVSLHKCSLIFQPHSITG